MSPRFACQSLQASPSDVWFLFRNFRSSHHSADRALQLNFSDMLRVVFVFIPISAWFGKLTADLCTIRKPKNARSKRALEARESKEVEDPRTVIFVRGTHTGEVVNGAMKDLVRSRLRNA